MATLAEMGIPGVGSGILMPKLKNRWRVLFQGIGRDGAGNGADLSLQATQVNRPNISFEEHEIRRYNSVAFVAGKHSWDELSLTVEDDITGRASQVVQSQLETQQKLIGATGPWLNTTPTASGYKFGTKIHMLDGNEGIVEEWLLEGCFIKVANYNDLDYTDSSQLTIALTIRFDHARQVLGGAGYGSALGGNL